MNTTRAILTSGCLVSLILAFGVTTSAAQSAGFKRTVLQRADISTPGRETVMAKIEFAPGVRSGKHTHPGEEVGYVVEGTLRFEIEGKATVVLKAGEAFFIEAERPHDVVNESQAPATIVGTYIVEKGKPLAAPVY